jgi:hypothetical protein
MVSRVWKNAAAGAIVALLISTCVLASDEFPISGTYTQDKPCAGDGSDPKSVLITITPEEMSYSSGLCSLSDRRRKGNTIAVHATCRLRNEVVMAGEVSFTMRDDNTLDMADQDKNYVAVLHKCPD